MKNKFFCFHGHFYQPPRENPWLGRIEPELSALPHENWNERILVECYGPMSLCPRTNALGQIEGFQNLYERISFNFGPTLLSWLEAERPDVYARILEADRRSAERRSGRGNAIAQPYVHAILPLLPWKEKLTLLRWGIEDFRSRFQRAPEGMWLPETAVDEETLEALASEGVRFTILAPWQAAEVRAVGEKEWRPVDERSLNPGRAYRWRSSRFPGRSVAVFFYFGGLAAAINARGGVPAADLRRRVANRLLPDDSVQLVHAANDGEFFGHHNRGAERELALALDLLEAEGLAAVNYGEFLDLAPPPEEVRIISNTAWSCRHGLGRWSDDCGCRYNPKSRQNWRRPLLEAMRWLGAELDGIFEAEGKKIFQDPWKTRDEYWERISQPEATEALLQRWAVVQQADRLKALSLLELQRHRLFMFTSCAWFFDTAAGLETLGALGHAARAIELAAGFGRDLSAKFRDLLRLAPTGQSDLPTAADAFDRIVRPRAVSLERASAHFALSELLSGAAEPAEGRFRLQAEAPVRAVREGLAGRDQALYAAWVVARDGSTEAEARSLAAAVRRDRLDASCWVVPGTDSSPEAVAAAFERDGAAGVSGALEEPSGGLDLLLPEMRDAAVRAGALPEGARIWDWLRAMRRLDEGDAEPALCFLEAWEKEGNRPEELPGLRRLRRHFTGPRAFGSLAGNLSHLSRWLDLAARRRLYKEDWELQEFAWRWRASLERRDAAPLEREYARTLSRRLGFTMEALNDHQKDHA